MRLQSVFIVCLLVIIGLAKEFVGKGWGRDLRVAFLYLSFSHLRTNAAQNRNSL